MSHITGYPLRKKDAVFNLSSPGPYVKVLQDHIGNLFSVFMGNPGGFQRYQRETWVKYPVQDIQLVNWLVAADFPFISTGANTILYLLPKKVMEFDAVSLESRMVLSSEQTGLGSFIHLTETSHYPVWITAERGVVRLESGELNQLPYQWKTYPLPESIQVKRLREPYIDHHGALYIVGDSESSGDRVLLEFMDGCWKEIYQSDRLERGWRDVDGVLWIQKGYERLMRIHDGREHLIENKNALSGQIYDIKTQPDGVAWIATSHGLARYSPSVWRTPSSLIDVKDLALTIYEDPAGRLWCAYRNILALKENGQWEVYPFDSRMGPTFHFQTDTLGMLRDGRLAIGVFCPDRCYFLPERRQFQLVHEDERNSYQYLAPHQDGLIWLVVHDTKRDIHSLMSFDGKQYEEIIPDLNCLQANDVKDIYRDQKNRIWIGTTAELALYSDGRFQPLDAMETFHNQGIFCIHEIEPGTLWFGGRNTIVQYKGNEWSIVRSDMDAVRSMITAQDGSIWIASQSGLHRFYQGIWTVYTDEDGLPDIAVYNVFEDRDGVIWAGTSRGISRYHPESDRDCPDTNIFIEENLSTTPPDGQVRIVFSGVDKWNQTQRDHILYSYRLDRRPWSTYRPATYASFSNLAPGSHMFEVRAMDRNRNVDPVPALFEFTVLQPWYQKLSVQITFCVCIGAIIILARLLIHRHLWLEKLVQERTVDLIAANQQLHKDAEELKQAETQLRSMASELILSEERERRRIASGLHDRIGHALAFIKIKIGQFLSTLTDEADKENLHSIQGVIDHAIKETHVLTFELSPPILYELGLEKAIHWLVKEFHKMSGVAPVFDDDGLRAPLEENVRIFLFQAVRELLMNTAKHAKAKRVAVSIVHLPETIVITIEDDGIGFSPSSNQTQAHKGFGLFSISQRLQHIGGDCRVESHAQQGTRIVLTAPIRRTGDCSDG